MTPLLEGVVQLFVYGGVLVTHCKTNYKEVDVSLNVLDLMAVLEGVAGEEMVDTMLYVVGPVEDPRFSWEGMKIGMVGRLCY